MKIKKINENVSCILQPAARMDEGVWPPNPHVCVIPAGCQDSAPLLKINEIQ